jgi:hypothetical protein
MIVQARIAAGIAAAAATGALLTACSTAGAPTAAAPGTPSTSTAAPTSASQASNRVLHFPNKTVTVTLTGYDPTLHLVQFQLAVFVAGGADDGHYAPDPKDPATHRLALAPNATMTSFSPDCTGAGGNADTPQGAACTTTQFVSALTDHSGAGPAKLHVNAQDQIDSAQGLYHP